MIKRIAITGGIACGKSLFSRTLERLGVEVLDADDVVHELEAPGGAAVPILRSLFGEGVMRADGGIDREVLGARVFADADARARLNGALHPLVRERLQAWVEQPGDSPKAVVVPLLFEVGWEDGWDMIVCLVSSEEKQVSRLVRTRGLSEEQARRRIAAQMPVAEKAARAHRVVVNEDSAEALAREAEEVYRLLMEKTE